MSLSHPSIRLEVLPPEILFEIVGYLKGRHLRSLSCVSKWMRNICTPLLFQNVSVEFSEEGFDGLEELLQSRLCSYVVSFQYVVPQLLKPEILDYATFKTQILTPESYVEECECWDDVDQVEEDDLVSFEEWDHSQLTGNYHPSYTNVYKTLRRIYAGQQRIIKTERDSALLSLAFQQFRCLTDLSLDFREDLEDVDWVKQYLVLGMTLQEKSHEYHVQRLSTAMESVKNRSVSIHTVQLIGLSFIYDDPWHIRDTRLLTSLLAEVLDHASRLRLLQSSAVLEMMSHVKLKIHQLELCSTNVARDSLQAFLRANNDSMQSIAFHDAHFIEQSWADNQLKPADVYKMIGIPVLKISEPSCQCSFQEGWKLFLDYECPLPMLSGIKRKWGVEYSAISGGEEDRNVDGRTRGTDSFSSNSPS